MRLDLYQRFFSQKFELQTEEGNEDDVISGRLISKKDPQKSYPIINGVPRILDQHESNYADNFGHQWNKFKTTQLDSHSGQSITADRLWQNSKWRPDELKGKVILEAGSGAGRFTELLLEAGATVVSFDYSNAVEANWSNNKDKGDLFLFQGDIFDMPFEDDFFDFVICYGVLQHTPSTEEAFKCLYNKLKAGGKITVDSYKHVPRPWYRPHYKYSWRPLTTKLPPKFLHFWIRTYMPIWLPIDTKLKQWNKPFNWGPRLQYVLNIPCWNYTQYGLNYKQRLQWAIMDTYDALGAYHDHPKTLEEIQHMVDETNHARSEVFYGGTGVVANLTKSD